MKVSGITIGNYNQDPLLMVHWVEGNGDEGGNDRGKIKEGGKRVLV